MRHVWLVAWYELTTILRKRSFWIMTFVLPFFFTLLYGGILWLSGQTMEQNAPAMDLETILTVAEEGEVEPEVGATAVAPATVAAEAEVAPTAVPQSTVGAVAAAPTAEDDELGNPIGLVDQAGVASLLPPNVPAEMVLYFATEAEAETAVRDGRIQEFFVLPPDLPADGRILVVSQKVSPFYAGNNFLLRYLLAYNASGDALLTAALMEPVDDYTVTFSAPLVQEEKQVTTFLLFVAGGLFFLFFFIISMSSGYMLQSVVLEKENRTMEILLLSLRPQTLMLGKLIGLTGLALFQMSFWFGALIFFMVRSIQQAQTVQIDASLPVQFWVGVALFFALGYVMYVTLVGVLGAATPNMREGGQFVMLLTLPLLLPLLAVGDADGPWMLFMSLFPLTAPIAMPTRLAYFPVPAWQIGLSVGLMVLVMGISLHLMGRFFRPDMRWSHVWRR
jgi:ABC-2 type transport system permease protein